MEQDRWRRMWELFHEALERPERERETFPEAACGADAELRDRIRALPLSHERAGGFWTGSRHLAPSASRTRSWAPASAPTGSRR